MLRRILVLGLCLLTSCAHQTIGGKTQDGSAPAVNAEASSVPNLPEVTSFRVTDPQPPSVEAEELETIPTDINPYVEKWISYFQGKGRPHMERYLARSTRYMPLMKKILRQAGLPEDLIYIALIESGFTSHATSHAAAVGYWQFIRGTGKRYGLEINSVVDDRRDYVLSTQAAAEYFKGLYSVFGSWYLSMASYNAGENRIKKEVINNMTRDFWELTRKHRLPRETMNYVPKFLAAKIIGKNPDKYGFSDLDYLDPIEFDQITVTRPVNLRKLAQEMDLDYDDIRTLNPKYKGEVAPLKGEKLELRVPVGKTQVALAAVEKAFVDKVEFIADTGDLKLHKVKSGETLSTIAKKYRTNLAFLRDVNDLSKGKRLRIGQKLFVPSGETKKTQVVKQESKKGTKVAVTKTEGDTTEAVVAPVTAPVAVAEKAERRPEVVTSKGVFYIVQKGDTLTEIAEEYNSSVEEIRKMNKLKKRSKIKVGMRLKVPKDEPLPQDLEGNGTEASDNLGDNEGNNDANVSGRAARRERSAATSRSNTKAVDAEFEKFRSQVTQKAKLPKLSRQSKQQLIGKVQQLTEKKVALPKKQKKIHVVKKGESLIEIAEQYGTSIGMIKSKNRIRNESKILAGSKLLIPLTESAE